MASQLELRRAKMELSSITYAKAQTEFRIQEYQDLIDQLQSVLGQQIDKEKELISKLNELEK